MSRGDECEAGGEDSQGRALGILDGCSGLFGAVLATLTVALFGALMPEDPDAAPLAQKAAAFSQVIRSFMVMTVLESLLVWRCVPETSGKLPTEKRPRVTPLR